jgi:hypothetical protein
MVNDTARDVGRFEASMLGIYLNDHLAGATAGTELLPNSDPTAPERTTARSGASRLRSHRTAPPCWISWLPRHQGPALQGGRRLTEKARLKFNGRLCPVTSATWKNWKCCGSAWKERPRAGAP